MATKFTNKYMQVFQNYNEFGEHSADYVRGEDHIAFLIEENEVIYWLYLEQVWRPLNVRTTTTGELEDGRTKVAVRLEYVEGGQKYTSVPNIPDPERITSMSHFLEDYPDIEEVNVSGTVNLTDLSYAFVGSKIIDFSMLDTGNVTNINHFCDSIERIGFPISIEVKCVEGNQAIRNLRIQELKIYERETQNGTMLLDSCTLVNYETNIASSIDNSNINLITSENNVTCYSNNKTINVDAITTTKDIIIYLDSMKDTDDVHEFGCDKIIFIKNDSNKYYCKYEVVAKTIELKNNVASVLSFPFGYGIDNRKNATYVLANNKSMGNFIFTTPIVDDAFYAKYNHPISIFQYKTTFTEVADVKITEATNSSLIYVDWNSIDFDTRQVSIEINNAVSCVLNTNYYTNYNVFKKLIIDNSKIDLGNDADNYPSIQTLNANYTAAQHVRNIDFDNYRISGRYKNNSNKVINDSRFKDIIIYCNNKVYETTIDAELDFNTERNIKIYDYSYIGLYVDSVNEQNVNYRIDSLIENNELNISFIPSSSNCGRNFNFRINYVEGIKLIIKANSVLTIYRNWLEHSTADNPVIVNGILQNTFSITTYFDYHTTPLESCYMNFSDKGYIQYIDGGKANSNFDDVVSKNFYGIINIKLSSYISSANYTDCGIKHIDLNKVLAGSGSAGDNILRYQSCDDETTINLITKLIDNTSSSSTPTIYMYRSQSNIIGEENIAAAVAKNYEFAIIEN